MRRSRSILNLVYVHQVDEDRSHATGPSKVPKSVQDAVPKGVEESLPDSIHATGSNPGQSTNKTHAKNDGQESILPKKVQEKIPGSVERAVPNAIHDTGDT
ncbi:hypothetical protein NW760_001489 [Fusarium oxysporum]|nr:hypothetical protein NW753_013152 [Fusarium oxysporum]KAJ4038023.1 hypothetical protein NW763_013073 [Fusarium oxysporum]KAJ4114576.1 hypothetical protein NW769_005376 [Fusarium oxysporum]KAJ4241196.1 hypothetical protein NW760_001489 [Fusarium oxysporum]